MENMNSCRILAISDYDWTFSVRHRLDVGGCTEDELRFAAGGMEGLAVAEQDPPDLIIYGLLTLDLDGYEFCRRLQWLPALQDVPVLLVGWLSPRIVYPKAQRAGAAGYLYSAVHAHGLVEARNALLRGETYYPPESMPSAEPATPAGQEGCRVLIIDDTPTKAEIAHMILARERNDEVRYANSGPKGLAAARQNPPDLVILDVMMPGWDGFETLRQFRMTSGLEEVPVIFQTAYGRAYDRAKTMGASGCLLAPYRGEELIAARDSALRGEEYIPASERGRG
jgi:CheY-like chemotaxis protein